ncbi:MAG: hypothetical protein ACYCQI_16200 [Gammaproteobacteria bacterium]
MNLQNCNISWNTNKAFDAVIKGIKAFCQVKMLEKQLSISHQNKFFTQQGDTLKSKQSEQKSDFVPVPKRQSSCVIL